ncbi:MAG TPA: site-2 protease family protein, partial [Candidatus Paceibacterota bacterium]|nr:site-2 protease family protein [Candidatus Paceibacterota bacterium]
MILLSFAAVISLNLAIINLVPFPALDGGRLLFLAIESVIRRPLPQKLTMWANGIGFILLVLLMLIITVSDVVKSFA